MTDVVTQKAKIAGHRIPVEARRVGFQVNPGSLKPEE